MTQSKKLLILFLVLVIAALFVLYKTSSQPKLNTVTETPESSIADGSTVSGLDELTNRIYLPSDWKLYNNEEWQFSVAYPNSASLKEEYSSGEIYNIVIESQDDCVLEINKKGSGVPSNWTRLPYNVGPYTAVAFRDPFEKIKVVTFDTGYLPLKNRIIFWFENSSSDTEMEQVSTCERILSTLILFN